MEAQQKENARLPVLKDQLEDTEKRLANLPKPLNRASTSTTKQRLDRLEAQESP